MAFCGNCGTKLEEGVKYCPSCGSAAPPEKAAGTAADLFTDMPDSTADYDPADISGNKAFCILCYLWILFLIPLLTKPNSPFVRYHVNQGLVLFIFGLAVMVVSAVPSFGWIAGLAGWAFSLVCIVLGIVNSLNGKAKALPLIGKIVILK